MAIDYRVRIVTTTPYNIVGDDEVVMMNVAGPSLVVLPATGGGDRCDKRSLYIKDFAGTSLTNPITITSAGGKTIDGVSFAILNGGYSHIQVVYDGTNWKTIA